MEHYLFNTTTMRTLTKAESDKFLNIHKHLILFTNQKHRIYDRFKTIGDLCRLGEQDKMEGIKPIREKMYEDGNINAFCRDNPFHLKEKDLAIASSWKNHFSGKMYMMRHLAEYTVFLSEQQNQLYGVKSITTDLADMYPSTALPSLVKAILLPFEGHIIYDSFLFGYAISFGSGIRKNLTADYNQIKALHGIYSHYEVGDNLENPPETSSLKDNIEYSIKQSLARNEFPCRALEFAETHDARVLFEHTYSKHYIPSIKKAKKYNDELPKMVYGVYRECVIAIMPTKKELMAFCQKNYPEILPYITIFSI
ncbi:hypothetical protein [Legionella sainthelensi]|uniref:hypothetical protein n=1 Tax=Legionella sainthelensi TaxID=28087 RepID=UPI0013572C15|nr:hypothetical protein [Legionella sainthelensi]